MKKRILSLLLALTLVLGLLPAAQAAGSPTLFCDAGTDGSAFLTLEDLRSSGVYGVQLELTLEGEFPRCVFTPASRTAYAPDCTVDVLRGTTRVTVYLTDRSALDQDGYLELGELDAGTPGAVWPGTARLTLLDEDLRPTVMSVPVAVLSGGPALPREPQSSGEPVLPDESGLPVVLPFTDVKAGDWFYDAVAYVYGKGMMQGVSGSAFAPYTATNRAMVVTILHRMEGSPAALPAGFTDVAVGQYYAGPVAWASGGGIVTGYPDNTFRPQISITREQMAAILYRYAGYRGLNVSMKGDLNAFADAGTVSAYAVEAMRWAVAAGLINGENGRLNPGGDATRAQVAAIFQRFCVNVLGLT